MKRIAVVILNWNGIELLKKFIPNTINNSEQANIYVIDNFSEDDSVDFLKRNYLNIKVIELDKNYGFAEGYNLGLKEIDEEIYCLMNSDIKVTKNWLEPVINNFDNNNVSIAQPIILDYNKEDHFEYAGAAGGFIDKFGYPFCRGRIINSIEKNLNQYKDSKILITGKNFGCGSSREHAPWSIADYGIKCIIASSYADIFYNNCFKNGILPITISDEKIKEISEYANRKEEIAINLPDQKIIFGNKEIKFEIDEFKKKCLLEGVDDIALSLEKSDKIVAYENKLKSSKPWIFND